MAVLGKVGNAVRGVMDLWTTGKTLGDWEVTRRFETSKCYVITFLTFLLKRLCRARLEAGDCCRNLRIRRWWVAIPRWQYGGKSSDWCEGKNWQ